MRHIFNFEESYHVMSLEDVASGAEYTCVCVNQIGIRRQPEFPQEIN
jgi:hypothetical protein